MSDDLTELDATLAIFDYAYHTSTAEMRRARKLERAFRRHRLRDRSDLREAIDAMDSADAMIDLSIHAAKELRPILMATAAKRHEETRRDAALWQSIADSLDAERS